MKKVVMLGVLISMFMTNTAFADVLPEGTKAVPVCAYFDNTASVLDTMAVYGYQTAPGGEKVDFSSFIANECFTKSYKFNSYKVYGVTAAHAATINAETYNPSTDPEAYPTNIQPEIGQKTILSTSDIERYENVYHIVQLDTAGKQLIIEPVKTITYYVGGTKQPETTVGQITPIVETPTLYENVFTDVTYTNKYYTALKYLKDNGIVGGYSDGSYKPDNKINRAEFTKIIIGAVTTQEALTNCAANYTKVGDYNVTLFPDVVFVMVGGNEPSWFFDYVCVAKFNGIIKGYSDGTFKPDRNINFAEAAKIVTNAMEYQTETPSPPV